MKRTILLLLLSAISSFGDEPWPGVKFTEVRAYAWPNDKETEKVILPGMKLKPGGVNKDGAVLSSTEIEQLLAAISGKHAEYPVALCYSPHNAFVFYDASKRPVAYLEICFGCFNHTIDPDSKADSLDLLALASIFADHKLPMGDYADLAAFKKDFAKVRRTLKK